MPSTKHWHFVTKQDISSITVVAAAVHAPSARDQLHHVISCTTWSAALASNRRRLPRVWPVLQANRATKTIRNAVLTEFKQWPGKKCNQNNCFSIA